MTEAEADPVDPRGADQQAAEWPVRPWLLAGLFGTGGLLIHLFTHGRDDVPWQMAASAFVFFGAIAAGFTIERDRWREPAIFAGVIGLVMAGLAWRAVSYGQFLPDEQYGFAAGAVASALALPLFQAGFHHRRFRTPYRDTFHHIWTDAISAAGALAFTGLSWIVLALLSELFHLLKLDFLKDLMDDGWFGWTFSGLAAGTALGTLRNQAKVIGTLQTVVLLVASLIAVPFAAGLVVFLLATAVSGPQVLWDATRSATPLLLACAAGAFVLTSAILRQDDAAMTRNRAMRLAALVLAIVILPLAVFAALSMGLRLDQYGLAPERLWGLVAIVVACAWGLGYWVALLRGRKRGWTGEVRQANFNLALGACALALLLALPLLDFGAMSTRNQVARLERGEVSPERFDFAALRWDFGEPGRRALARLARSGNATIAELAANTLRQSERTYASFDRTNRTRADFQLRVEPNDGDTRQQVLDYLVAHPYACSERCVALDLGEAKAGGRRIALVQSGGWQELWLRPGGGLTDPPPSTREPPVLESNSVVEVSEARVIRVDGQIVGAAVEDAAN